MVMKYTILCWVPFRVKQYWSSVWQGFFISSSRIDSHKSQQLLQWCLHGKCVPEEILAIEWQSSILKLFFCCYVCLVCLSSPDQLSSLLLFVVARFSKLRSDKSKWEDEHDRWLESLWSFVASRFSISLNCCCEVFQLLSDKSKWQEEHGR